MTRGKTPPPDARTVVPGHPVGYHPAPGVDVRPQIRLKAKPAALAARGKPIPENHGAGDVQREDATRVLNAGLAVVRLEDAARSAKEARECLSFLLGDKHHATAAAARSYAEASRAKMLAVDVLRTIKRNA